MTKAQYDEIKRYLIETAFEIETAKRPEYTIGDEDVLANFKRVGKRFHVSPAVVAGIYGAKHDDSVSSILANPTLPRSEPAIGRFADRLNYLALGLALLVEAGYVTIPTMGNAGQLKLPLEG